MSAQLFIDGENLRHYVEDVLELGNHKDKKINDIDLPKLLESVLKGLMYTCNRSIIIRNSEVLDSMMKIIKTQ